MKHEIIKTDDYLLVVDESEIKEGDYGLGYAVGFQEVGKGNFIFQQNGSASGKLSAISKGSKKIIAHLPLNGSPILEGVDLLPPLEDEVDVEKKAEKFIGCEYEDIEDNIDQIGYDAFIRGYNQALEDNKDKKYTEEDMRKAFLKGVSVTAEGYNAEYAQGNEPDIECEFGGKADKFIQSLSQPKMPIGFECETETRVYDTYPEKRNINPKTTTTPEGHTQWVGKYIYA